jgi:hypothetical protein
LADSRQDGTSKVAHTATFIGRHLGESGYLFTEVGIIM